MSSSIKRLLAQAITPSAFAPYGQVIFPTEDGKIFDAQDAQLHLQNGTPRFYLMRLDQPSRQFHRITRHRLCTQCLGSLAGKDWFIGVAPPGKSDRPRWEDITVFHVPGDCLIKLELGTWHAGPFFDHDWVDFYNLELSDTNLVDHDTCDLRASYGLTFAIDLPPK